MDEAVRRAVKSGKPVMGICLGMQLLFERSYEYGEHPGLGLLEGEVVGMEGRLPKGLAIPHIGWNALRINAPAACSNTWRRATASIASTATTRKTAPRA